MPGQETSNFGEQLTRFVEEAGLSLRVFYDHGDPSNPNVGKIYGHVGDQASASTNLAEIDVLVVNDSNQILLIIEIEEKAQLGPKKILGLLMAVLFSEKFTFNENIFSPTANSIFICAGQSNPKGANRRKIKNEIAPRIKALSITKPGMLIHDVRYVLEDTLEEVLKETEKLSKQVLLS